MKKLIAALLALLMFASAALAQPGPPPRPPRGGPAPGRGPAGPPPRPRPGPGPKPGIHRPPAPRPMHPMRPGHRPPPPPRYYRPHHRHDGWFWGGLGIGIVISALANNASSNYNAQRDYERRAEEVRRAARETAEIQSRRLAEVISRIGSESALYELNDYWRAQGQRTTLDTSDPVRSLAVSGFRENLRISYWLDRAANEGTVTVTAPAYNVSESIRTSYTEPPLAPPPPALYAENPAPPAPHAARPAPPAQQGFRAARPTPPAPPRAAAYDVTPAFKHLGFTLAEDARTPQGYLTVQSVTPATAAAYTGVKKGATLYKIDGNSTAQVSVEQLCAFIDRRAAAEAVVEITFSENGKEKNVRLQL